MQIRPVCGCRQGEGERVCEGGLRRQSFASIHLLSISGPINEELERGGEGRGQRTPRGQRPGVGGATEWEIKRARAVIREEFQPSGNKSNEGGAPASAMHCNKKSYTGYTTFLQHPSCQAYPQTRVATQKSILC